jgi:hypothetical protein
MTLFCSAPSPGVAFSLPIGSLRGESAKMQLGQCTRFVLVLQLFFSVLHGPSMLPRLIFLDFTAQKEAALSGGLARDLWPGAWAGL